MLAYRHCVGTTGRDRAAKGSGSCCQLLWKSKHGGSAYIQVGKASILMPSTKRTFRGTLGSCCKYYIHYAAWRWKLVSSPLSRERHVPLWRETRDAAPGFGATALTLLPVGPSGTEFTRHRRFSLLTFSVFSLLPFSFLLLARGVGDRGRLRRRKPAAGPPSGRRPAGALQPDREGSPAAPLFSPFLR